MSFEHVWTSGITRGFMTKWYDVVHHVARRYLCWTVSLPDDTVRQTMPSDASRDTLETNFAKFTNSKKRVCSSIKLPT